MPHATCPSARVPLRVGLLLSALLSGVAGCGHSPVGPTDSSRASDAVGTLDGALLVPDRPFTLERASTWSSFFPLDSADVWTYALEIRATYYPGGGRRPDPRLEDTTTITHGSVVRRMDGTDVINGLVYARAVETQVEEYPGGNLISQSVLDLRQDATGLYEFSSFTPASSAASPGATRDGAAGTSPEGDADRRFAAKREVLDHLLHGSPIRPPSFGDARLLAYPVKTGDTWRSIPSLPGYTMTVEGLEGVQVGRRRLMAWRVRADSPAFGSGDGFWMWFGEDGLLEVRSHMIEWQVDGFGNLVPAFVEDRTQIATSIVLHRQGTFLPKRIN